jgi:hypothetical protein
MEDNFPTSSEPSAPPPTLTIPQAVRLLFTVMLVLLLSCLVSALVAAFIVQHVAPDHSNLMNVLVFLGSGSLMTLLLSRSWRAQQVPITRWWIGITVLLLSAATFVMGYVSGPEGEDVCEVFCEPYPWQWIVPELISSLVLAVVQWLMLRRSVRHAERWAIVIGISWAIFWFLVRSALWDFD